LVHQNLHNPKYSVSAPNSPGESLPADDCLRKRPSVLPVIALNMRWDSLLARWRMAAGEGFAVEYTPDPNRLDLIPVHLGPSIAGGVPVRYHGYFPNQELALCGGPDDPSWHTYTQTLRAMRDAGGQVITVHIQLNPGITIDPHLATDNLARLVETAGSLGITVALENLRRGYTSHPEHVEAMARASGAMITLDMGHAICCERTKTGELSLLDFIRVFQDRLIEVHMYGREEEDGHHPLETVAGLEPAIEALLATGCRWWTIELNNDGEALATRAVLLDYLKRRETNYTRGRISPAGEILNTQGEIS
jgi:sugar phosphate isomerase/epimerase